MNNYIIKNNDILAINSNSEFEITGCGDFKIQIYDNVDAKIYLKGTSSNLTIEIGEYSTLTLCESHYSGSINTKVVNLADSAKFNFKYLTISETSDDLKINLNGYKSLADVEYLVLNKDTKSKYVCLVTHNARETKSVINNIGLALDNSNIWFDTVGQINKGMSKSNARQLARGVIIGEHANIVSQPVLKIDEYDVQANHGTAIGRMSDNELFYLMSRGLKKEEAYRLILFGIINPVVDAVWNKDCKEEYKEAINKLL